MIYGIYTTSIENEGAAKLKRSIERMGNECKIIVANSGFNESEVVQGLDGILPRYKHDTYQEAARLVKAAKACGIPSTITSQGIESAHDKWLAYQVMSSQRINTPETILIESVSGTSRLDVFGYPVIIKPRTENKGIGVLKADSQTDALDMLRSSLDHYETVLLQEFISEAAGEDYRLVVVGDEVVTAMRRRAAVGDFRANLSQGGSGEAYQPSKAEVDIAVRAAKSFGALVCGVDVLKTSKGPMVLEVNGSLGFGIEDITGVAVTDLIVKHMMSKGTQHD